MIVILLTTSFPIYRLFEEESDDFYSFGAIYCAEIVRILENGIMVILREGTKPMLLRNSDISLQIKHASAHGLQVIASIRSQILIFAHRAYSYGSTRVRAWHKFQSRGLNG